MSNVITTQTGQLPQGLQKAIEQHPESEELQLLSTTYQPKLAKMTVEQKLSAKQLLTEFVTNAAQTSGFQNLERISQKECEQVITQLLQVIKIYSKRITLGELRYILGQGLIGNLGGPNAGKWQTYGLTPRSLNYWISQYLEEERPKLVKRHQQLLQQLPPKPKEDHGRNLTLKFLDEVQAIKEKFADRLEAGGRIKPSEVPHTIDMGNVIYNLLIKNGSINLSLAEKKRIYKEEIATAKNNQLSKTLKINYTAVERMARFNSKKRVLREHIAFWLSEGKNIAEKLTQEKN